jgi:hypothetical protein
VYRTVLPKAPAAVTDLQVNASNQLQHEALPTPAAARLGKYLHALRPASWSLWY